MVKKSSEALASDFEPREPPENGERFIKRGSGDLSVTVTEDNQEILESADLGLESIEIGGRIAFEKGMTSLRNYFGRNQSYGITSAIPSRFVILRTKSFENVDSSKNG